MGMPVLTPASFIFEVNPSHFGAYSREQQGSLNGGNKLKTIQHPVVKSIKADVEGFYWQNKEEESQDGSYYDGEEGPTDPHEFIRRHQAPEGIGASVSLNPEMSTIELKDNKNNLNYAARIQIQNRGAKKLYAMNWSLRQVLVRKGVGKNYPLPDLDSGESYDLIFNLNLKEKTREVTYWSLCLLDKEGEEAFFGSLLKATLENKLAKVSILEEKDVAAYTSGLFSRKMEDDI